MSDHEYFSVIRQASDGFQYVRYQEAMSAIDAAHHELAVASSYAALWDMGGWLVFGAGLLVLLLMILGGIFFTVKQQTAVIIERFGRFKKIAMPGLNVKVPFIDKRVDEVNLRVTQLALEVDTKTLDDVFVKVDIAIQYAVLPECIMAASYALDDEEEQITSYVYDIIRGSVPSMKLDAVFAQKDQIASDIQTELNEKIAVYGYKIHHALVTDIVPDDLVRKAMNEINASQRLRMAATEKGEADKVLIVKAAEADMESDILGGKGLAGQRQAIIDGLRESVEKFQSSVPGMEAEKIMNVVLLTQYFDTLKEMADSEGSRVIFASHHPGSVETFGRQIQEALEMREKVTA